MMKILRDEEHEPVAMFELEDDGTVTATYVFPMLKEEFEGQGLRHNGRTLRPKDGQAFLDALDTAYALSSRLYVQTLE